MKYWFELQLFYNLIYLISYVGNEKVYYNVQHNRLSNQTNTKIIFKKILILKIRFFFTTVGNFDTRWRQLRLFKTKAHVRASAIWNERAIWYFAPVGLLENIWQINGAIDKSNHVFKKDV